MSDYVIGRATLYWFNGIQVSEAEYRKLCIPNEPSTDAWYTLVNEWLATHPSEEYTKCRNDAIEHLSKSRAKRRTFDVNR